MTTDDPTGPAEPVAEGHDTERESIREPTWLAAGLPLSYIVGVCSPVEDPLELLKQTGKPSSVEAAAGEAAEPDSVTLSAQDDPVLTSRLAKSKHSSNVGHLEREITAKQEQLDATDRKDEARKEALNAEIDDLKAKLVEATTALAELKATFADDATALAPWMNSLFAHVDMGVTTFAVGGEFWPHCDLTALFKPRDGAVLTAGIEALLAAFKRRCELERGPGAVQLVLRLMPNIFRADYSLEAIGAAVARLMKVQGIDADGGGAASLDAVELVWWDSATHDAVAAVKELSRLCVNETQADAAAGEGTAARKIKALGVYNFAAKDLLAAITAGATISFVRCRFGLHCWRSSSELLAFCRDYGIPVLGDEVLMHGLLDESFIGLPCTSVADESALLPSLKDAVSLIKAYGGWDRVQALLATVKRIADKHGVKMQTVALRWQVAHGVVPCVPVPCEPDVGAAFGHRGSAASPPADAELFGIAGFLDAQDMAALDALSA